MEYHIQRIVTIFNPRGYTLHCVLSASCIRYSIYRIWLCKVYHRKKTNPEGSPIFHVGYRCACFLQFYCILCDYRRNYQYRSSSSICCFLYKICQKGNKKIRQSILDVNEIQTKESRKWKTYGEMASFPIDTKFTEG